MKLSCDVIKDMLPLYHDEVCSEDTKKLVEEHLNECETCRTIADKMNMEVSVFHQELEETAFFKNIQQKLRKRDFLFAIIAVFLIFLVGFGSYFARTYKFIPVGASSFEISQVSRLSDDSIGFYIRISDGKDVCYMTAKHATEDGVVYIQGKRSLIEESINYTDSLGYSEEYFYYNASSYNQWLSGLDQTANGDLPYIAEIRFGTEGDYVLLWKEGMELPKASEAMEDDYAKHIYK